MKKIENAFLPPCLFCPDRRGLMLVEKAYSPKAEPITNRQQWELDKWYRSNDGEYYIETAYNQGQDIPICSTCMNYMIDTDKGYVLDYNFSRVIPARKTYYGPRKNRK